MSLVTDYAKSVKGTPRCVQCGEFIEDTLSPVEEKEFQRSGLCPKCFKEAMEEMEIVQPKLTMNNWAAILSLVRQELRRVEDAELRIIEDAIIDMAFEKAKGGQNDKT